MKTAVRLNVGVRVCVGIAPTKALAKLANKWPKNNPSFNGAGDCVEHENCELTRHNRELVTTGG